MQTIEMYFNDTIAKYSLFKQAAASLVQEIPSLTPIDIDNRCQELTTLYNRLLPDKNHLFSLMEFMGPSILDTSYISEFQRALDKSIDTCNVLYEELRIYKDNLISAQSENIGQSR
jgi:hypothetical protein